MRFKEILISEMERIPLFSPVILGLGIILGVFFPFFNWQDLIVFATLSVFISFLIAKKSKILSYATLILSLGVYVVQTGGIFKTELLSQKEFIEHEYDNITFEATVKFVDETHPTMKNMRRITFKDMKFENNILKFIKTAKMTCSARMTEEISPNDIVKVRGKISPYKQPAIPGSFDQIQYNSLIGLDTTGIVYHIEKTKETATNDWFSSLRRKLTKQIIKCIKSPAGGIASALLTGDKSSIPTDIREKFINSGTAHILAISGLHMSIVASIVFFLFMKLFQYLSVIFIRISPKRISAIVTIPITFLYLALSGFSPSATRAFIMTTVFLISVICGRGNLSLRSVAVAAFAILLFDSGAIFLVSFQLSFSAVVALIAFYETFQDKLNYFKMKRSGFIWKFCFYIIASLISTIIASLATLPISIAVFNRLSLSGLLGNIIAIPATTFIIIPLGIFSLISGGFIDFPIHLLEFSLNNMTFVLGKISEIPGSNLVIKSPEMLALYSIMIGGIVLCLLKSKARFLGFASIIFGVVLWIFQDKPYLIFPPDTESVCFIENEKFYTTSLQKGRKATLSIQRNLGFSGNLIKKKFNGEIKNYSRGLYVWKSGKIKELAERKHPYCPAYWINAKHF